MRALLVLVLSLSFAWTTSVWALGKDSLEVAVLLEAPTCADTRDGTLVFLPKGSRKSCRIALSGPLPCTDCTVSDSLQTDTLRINGLAAGNYRVRLQRPDLDTLLFYSLAAPEPLMISQTSLGGLTCPDTCDGSIAVQLSGGTAPYTFDWGAGLTTQSAQGNLCAGKVQLRVRDREGCTLQTTFQLDPPPSIDIDLIAQAPSCPGAKDGVLAAAVNQSPVYYSWSTGADTAVLTELVQGTYQLTVTNTQGCRDSVQYWLAEPAPIDLQFAVKDPDCRSTSAGEIQIQYTRGGNGGYVYALDSLPFVAEPILENLSPGSHTLRVKDRSACLASFPFVVKPLPDLRVNIPKELTISLGDRLSVLPESISGAWQYRWWQGTETLAMGPLLDIPAALSGAYIIEVLDPISACRLRDTLRVNVDKTRRVYFPTAFSPNGDGTNDDFGVFGGADVREVRGLEVYNRYGQLVFRRGPHLPNTQVHNWNGASTTGEELPPGSYIYWAEILFVDGQVEIFKGEVSLLR
ncbi:MAG TPA: gliding motility-associated C-terminal domain-containing protein [Saprospiraceae bacterium]|nr:gliding motility-associated C-terminal domain-containing protein [Saprospiraceae bacterium]